MSRPSGLIYAFVRYPAIRYRNSAYMPKNASERMDYTPEQLRTGVLKTCDEIVCEQYLGEMYLQRLLRSTLVGSFALCSCNVSHYM